jgi:hypothetical protein
MAMSKNNKITLITGAEVARAANVTKFTITRLARQHKIGTRTPIGWVFTKEDATAIKQKIKPVGRPRKH